MIALLAAPASIAQEFKEDPAAQEAPAVEAEESPGCRSVDDVFATTKDEVCDKFVDEAVACFRTRRAEVRYLDEQSAKKSKAEFIADAEAIKKQYGISLQVLKSYLGEMRQEACGNQAVSIKTWIEEFTFDQKKLTERINKAKKTSSKKR